MQPVYCRWQLHQCMVLPTVIIQYLEIIIINVGFLVMKLYIMYTYFLTSHLACCNHLGIVFVQGLKLAFFPSVCNCESFISSS